MTIKCPCGKEHSFTNRSNYNRALKGSGLCNACARKGQKRTAEQRQQISEATKLAMRQPDVYERFINSYTPENRKQRSVSGIRQMANMLKTDVDKFQWSCKVSQGTKNKWNSRPLLEKKKIRQQIATGRKKFNELMSNAEYKQNHVRKCLCNGKTKDTRAEKKVRAILELNKVEYVFQYQIQDKVFDFYIPSMNLLIEVDGTYWHGKGLKQTQLNSMQKKHKKNDEYKNNLAKSLGYNLERIWEDEISVNLVTERISQYVK